MLLPTTNIRGVEVTRLVVGGNPISGFSHQGSDRTKAMLDYFTMENTKKLLRDCEAAGINTFFGRADNFVMRLLYEHRNEGGTIQWFAQSAPERKDTYQNLAQCRRFGANGMYIHGGEVGRLFEEGKPEEIKAMLARLQDFDCPVGIAAHDPQQIEYAEAQGWPVDFYMVCVYNVTSYHGKLGVEGDEMFIDAHRQPALDTCGKVAKPCFAYKILGAGRKHPRDSFPEVFAAIKPTDGVCVGMFPEDDPDIARTNAKLVRELTAARP